MSEVGEQGGGILPLDFWPPRYKSSPHIFRPCDSPSCSLMPKYINSDGSIPYSNLSWGNSALAVGNWLKEKLKSCTYVFTLDKYFFKLPFLKLFEIIF